MISANHLALENAAAPYTRGFQMVKKILMYFAGEFFHGAAFFENERGG